MIRCIKNIRRQPDKAPKVWCLGQHFRIFITKNYNNTLRGGYKVGQLIVGQPLSHWRDTRYFRNP